MNLKEARTLKSRMIATKQRLNFDRIRASLVDIAPKEDPRDYVNELPNYFTSKIDSLIEEMLKLNEAIRQANNKKVFCEALDGMYSVNQLIDQVKALREEASYFSDYSKKLAKVRIVNTTQELVTAITYDLKEYKSRFNYLSNNADLISSIIDQLDSSTEVDYTLPDGVLDI